MSRPGYECTNTSHKEFKGYCGQTRYKYDPSLRDKDDNMVNEDIQEHMEYMLYKCYDGGCDTKYTRITNTQTRVARFFVGEQEPKTFDDAVTTFESGTHFHEVTL